MLQTLAIALVPSVASFVIGCVIGYGRAVAKLARMEKAIETLEASVKRLEDLMLSHP